ncbi:hypothetical protein PAAG_03985 [Paracoccidioides lutzii Pb01]|uniref:Uncharacterized protein n=1 Tax=Paracoccidioides lutzii (strain ATCC MYA-826 / Pb01) TaxID=502779 RepID=C1GZP1_PARBA|nr:hypothetical protein PAAG_03985 [Paracoccidioides lutzii Pb01]EEH42064.2 hypothetical protein PAAG_03985 [Paracoccidioides lutzii Pb01]
MAPESAAHPRTSGAELRDRQIGRTQPGHLLLIPAIAECGSVTYYFLECTSALDSCKKFQPVKHRKCTTSATSQWEARQWTPPPGDRISINHGLLKLAFRSKTVIVTVQGQDTGTQTILSSISTGSNVVCRLMSLNSLASSHRFSRSAIMIIDQSMVSRDG